MISIDFPIPQFKWMWVTTCYHRLWTDVKPILVKTDSLIVWSPFSVVSMKNVANARNPSFHIDQMWLFPNLRTPTDQEVVHFGREQGLA